VHDVVAHSVQEILQNSQQFNSYLNQLTEDFNILVLVPILYILDGLYSKTTRSFVELGFKLYVYFLKSVLPDSGSSPSSIPTNAPQFFKTSVVNPYWIQCGSGSSFLGPGFDDKKNCKILQLQKIYIILN